MPDALDQPQSKPKRLGTANPAVSLAQRLKLRGRLDDAERVFKACLKADDKEKDAWLGLGLLYRDRGRLADAGYCLWRAVQLDPENRRLLLDLGKIQIRQGDYRRAATVFAHLVEKNPADLAAHLHLSVIRREQNDRAAARSVFEDGIRNNPLTVSRCVGRAEARILRVQGVQNSDFVLLRVGAEPEIILGSGNFPTVRLWSEGRFTTISYLVLDDNILRAQALPSHDVIVNTIADPDVEAEALRALAKFVKKRPRTPIINDPARVLETGRDRTYQRLKRRPGVVFPKTVRARADAAKGIDAADLLARHEMRLPVVLRVPGARSGHRVAKAETIAEAEAFLHEIGGGDVYLIDYIDCPYRDGFYRRMRVFFVDGTVYPAVHHIDRQWNVSGDNRVAVMAKHDWMMEAEKAFVNDPAGFLGNEIFARLQALAELVKLDFFGVDFSVTPAGDLLIYEMTPMMRHSFDYARDFPYLQPHLQKITRAFQAMLIERARSGGTPKRAAASRFAARSRAS